MTTLAAPKGLKGFDLLHDFGLTIFPIFTSPNGMLLSVLSLQHVPI